jgi:Fe-S oxidoreductase
MAQEMARRMIDLFDPFTFDAIITNAAGCGSHLKHYGRLLADDRDYVVRAREWDRKLKDINEWLVEIGFRVPASEAAESQKVTYHEACHLCHGQKITKQPREILRAIPGLELTELPESNWCCGSAGVYNITQPETAVGVARAQSRQNHNYRRRGRGDLQSGVPSPVDQRHARRLGPLSV